jgi:hypothetical protein
VQRLPQEIDPETPRGAEGIAVNIKAYSTLNVFIPRRYVHSRITPAKRWQHSTDQCENHSRPYYCIKALAKFRPDGSLTTFCGKLFSPGEVKLAPILV